ncbi:hypothetical protein VHEMI01715 [[Torrubiella] hemipterigena]|uniref:SpvB-domain-containing protein n=1 Tax=[Torrubiella] hemipterigena TaxID=1531966 RepID=A0A0A1T660_9HYPO|nr:hypothetical protein VHEMI01715 [[Torrubiella] hemipterigena]
MDAENSDVFLLSGMEDLVPVQQLKSDGTFVNKIEFRVQHGKTFRVARYNPRIESGFLRILRLTDTETYDTYWEVKTDNNITTIFGDSPNSRTFDPFDPSRVFEWLPSKTYDDKGNITLYEYKEEDSSGVDLNSLPELQRSTLSRTAARYIKRIKYGNTVSALSPTFKATNSWMFEIVFDYGDHDSQHPRSETSQPWPVRSDPFSSRRSCFEIRMYRLCRRILMFHHFPDEPGVGKDCVVASFNMNFETVNMDQSNGYSITTVLKSVTQEHWRRAKGDDYEKEHLPPLEFTYSMAQPSKQSKVLKSSSLANLPAGLTGDYQLVDLEGQGLAGVVLRTEGSLQYMANLANGEFGPTETISTNPSAVFKKGSEQWMDLCGGGKIELVQLSGSAPGFYERDLEEPGGWNTFRTFKSYPNVAWDNKQLKFLDLTGNGIADAVIIDDYELRIYPGLGNDGFGSPWYASPPTEEGPGSNARLLFWDGTEALYTSDMTGDGLADLVRVRYSEVCYWPNLGYGKFDRKVIMDGTPIFDSEELFDQKYLRLADIDGSGTTDIVYLGNRVTMYQNLSGNALSKGIEVPGFPGIDVSTNVQVTDLLGRGTACLVWSSNLASDSGRQIRYLDLMEAGKPYLLVSMDNNMGWETRLTYEASTQFYARDKKLGRPWTSLLPFPVQCVSKTEVVDRVSRNLFTTTYAYHDGFFDGVEREFRGFGMVETLDTEKYSSLESREDSFDNISKHTNVPPTLTKTWYHTGEYRDGAAVATYPDVPYWAGDKSQKVLRSLSETTLPSSIVTLSGTTSYLSDAQERREACRALRGNMMRSEIYAIDGSDLQAIPYLIKESNMHIEQRQRLGSNRHAVFFVRPKESLEMVYDRKQYRHGTTKYFDPRVSHTLTLETDYYGNPLKAMTVSYGREHDDPDPLLHDEDRRSQKKSYAVLSRTTTTNSLDQAQTYLLPKPAESQSYEIINIDICRRRHGGQNGRLGLVSFAEASQAVSLLATGNFDIPFENFSGPYPSPRHLYRRLLKESIAFYRRDDFNGPLPLGVIEPLGLPWKTFQLALSDSQAEQYSKAGKISSEDLNAILQSDCDYFRVPKRSGWWISSGEAFFSPDRETTAEEELREAREHFFVIRRSRPPWDRPEDPAESFYTFDKYDLLIQEARDAYDNRVTVGERAVDPYLPLVKMGNDYRLLRPFLVMDANRNHSEVLFDVLGNVIAAAAMGKPEENVGDSLEDVQRSLSDQEMRDFFQNPITLSKQLLGSATSRTLFDFFSYYRTKHDKHPQPNWVSSLSRETHVSDLAEGASSRVFVTMTYSDGSGRSIQTKAQCEPGPLLGPGCCEDVNEDAEAGTKDNEGCRWASTRWLVSSWVILNNKNKPVKQYEPFFSKTHAFQYRAIYGVSSTTLYDAVGRTVAVLSPDHTWTKVRFGPWSSDKWDKNDTVLIRDPSQDADVGPFFALLPREDYMPTWYQERAHGQMGAIQQEAAQKSAAAANTPTTVFFDSLGRVCLSLEVLRDPLQAASSGTILRQPSYIDVQGLPYKVTDTLGRLTSTSIYSIGGTVLSETNFDNGTKWVLVDSSGKSILTWNARQQRFKTEYDRNRRVIGLHLKEGNKEHLVEKSTYGETEPDPEKHNARGRIVRTYDQSGITKTPDYDFQGNIILSDRQLVSDYKNIIDWHCEDAVSLEPETFVEKILFDALSKPIQTVLPDGTVTVYHYNDRALINSVMITVPSSDVTSEAIRDIEYDAKGRRTKVVNGNGVQTVTSFDPLTFRICRIESFREHTSSSPSTSSSEGSPQHRLKPRPKRRRTKRYQDLRYTYDASGNITHVADKASKAVFFRNQRVEASQSFTYDSLYRLIEATGREHLGQMHTTRAKHSSGQNQPTAGDSIYHPNNGQALGRYVERYVYDAVNNLQKMHHSNLTENANWTRHYHYEEPSLVDNKQVNNRLSYTKIGDTIERYRYDGLEKESGSMKSMPGLPHLNYDYGEHMASSVHSLGSDGEAKETTYYKYDGTGKRVRKITERHSSSDKASIIKETIYIGGAFEVFRRYTAASKSLEVNNIRIMESGRQLLLIENRVAGGDDRLPGLLYRYQLANFQGSAQIELDQEGKLISYEEYTPYGISSVKANFEQTEIPKRYRFLGKERDIETGLYHLGARYYAPWLGRFVSADPKGSVDGSNLYQYSHGNPVMLADPGGTAAAPATGAPPPSAALGWTSDVIRSRARDWIVFENLPSWVSGLREWRVFGRMAAGDFAAMLQNRMIASGVKAADVAAKFEQYLPNATTGKRLGSSFIDFMFPALKQAYEHKLMDFTKYSEDGVLAVSELRSAFGGADGIIAQLEKHTANIAAKFGTGWETRLAVTIRGVEHGSPGWTAMTTEINDIMARAGQLAPMIEHANNPAIMAAREGLDSAAMAFIAKAGGLAKFVGAGAEVLGPLAVGVGVLMMPSQARAATNSAEKPSTRTQAALDLGSGVTSVGVAVVAAKATAITAAAGTTGAAVAAGVVVAGAAVGGAAAGALAGGYVADKVEHSEFAQEHLGETGAALAGYGTGVLAGAAAGALVGAAVGSVLPVVGTAAGAVIGGAAGALGAEAKILISKYWS